MSLLCLGANECTLGLHFVKKLRIGKLFIVILLINLGGIPWYQSFNKSFDSRNLPPLSKECKHEQHEQSELKPIENLKSM
jgi:hypothetical protein